MMFLFRVFQSFTLAKETQKGLIKPLHVPEVLAHDSHLLIHSHLEALSAASMAGVMALLFEVPFNTKQRVGFAQ